MDVSKFKDVIQSFFKGYSSLLMPVAIGLAAVLLFIPTQLMSSRLRQRIVDESINKRGEKIQRHLSNAVARDQYIEEKKYQQAYRNDANEISLLAKQSTQRELLNYGIFPKPKDISALIFGQFGKEFRDSIDELLAGLNARDCPTQIELDRALEGLSRPGYHLRRKRPGSKSSTVSRYQDARTTVVDVLCIEKAEEASVYANPTDLSGYEFWEEYEATSWSDAIEDCWYWQLGYWIIEDVVDTIAALNSQSSSKNVLTSPVKRLVKVNFPTTSKSSRSGYKSGRSSGTSVKVTGDKPKYILSIEDALAWPYTGRFSDKDIDIVHFNVSVVVSTKTILPFMKELCSIKQHKFRGLDGKGQEQLCKHNQITILESKVNPIDREDSEHNLYRYGEDAVVRLDLVCEYIFDRAGYDEIKPKAVDESIKKIQKEIAAEKAKEDRKTKLRKRRIGTKTKTEGKRGLPEI